MGKYEMSMPETIELPEAKDFCRGLYRNDVGQCCFEGWKQTLFPDLTNRETNRFRAIAENEAKKMRLNDGGSYTGVHHHTSPDKSPRGVVTQFRLACS